jgi:hypothetical protein
MAREVQSGKQRGTDIFPPMAQLGAGHDVYNKTVDDRPKAFPPNEMEWCSKKAQVLDPFVRQLRYDAESVFWLLLWWAVQAQPNGDDHTEGSSICGSFWIISTSESGYRESFIPNFRSPPFHPFYEPLDDLLWLLAGQLSGHPDENKEPSRKKDEYFHEGLQRIISVPYRPHRPRCDYPSPLKRQFNFDVSYAISCIYPYFWFHLKRVYSLVRCRS